ncbi:formyltransferase family protein [Desulfovibrio litoralis]|uniref:formyltransferase family protein n=1 Tax=Desulfovibrio litoralis TaxID=466107 RepID=UPI0015BA5EA7|nr:formyltransferase family protein [Desulfovibrio litoralis]
MGNRRFVLEEMCATGVNLKKVFVVANTHLERDLKNGFLSLPCHYIIINNKQELLYHLSAMSFDILVSNGCPYILPISQMPVAKYVNIHPSCLPDLRGVDPVIGAILFEKNSGATCHIMDDGVDTGDIISQVSIPYNENLDVTTLYQLSFCAEKQAFRDALLLKFQAQYAQKSRDSDIYYSRKPEDRVITFKEENNFILRKIKAFNNRTQGCLFLVNNKNYIVFRAEILTNCFLTDYMQKFMEGIVAFSYENSILFKKDNEILRFSDISFNNNPAILVGDKIFEVQL